MTTCRTIAEVLAAGLAAGDAMPPLTQDQADDIAVILAASRDGENVTPIRRRA